MLVIYEVAPHAHVNAGNLFVCIHGAALSQPTRRTYINCQSTEAGAFRLCSSAGVASSIVDGLKLMRLLRTSARGTTDLMTYGLWTAMYHGRGAISGIQMRHRRWQAAKGSPSPSQRRRIIALSRSHVRKSSNSPTDRDHALKGLKENESQEHTALNHWKLEH